MSYLATKLTGSNKMVLNDQTLPTVVNFHFFSMVLTQFTSFVFVFLMLISDKLSFQNFGT